MAIILVLGSCRSGGSRATTTVAGHVRAWSLEPAPVFLKAAAQPSDTSGGIIGAIRTKGGMAVAELSDQQIRFYDEHAHIVRTGFPTSDNKRRLLWAGRCPGNDLIVTQDFGSQHFTFFNDSGDTLKSIPIAHELAFAQLVACPRDGSLLIFHTLPASFNDGTSISRGQLVRVDDMGHAAVVHEFRGTEYFYSKRDKIFTEQPLGRLAMVAATRNEILVGGSDESGIEILGPRGEVNGRIDTHIAKRQTAVGDLLEAITLRIYREASASSRQILRAAIVRAPLRSSQVAFDAMIADKESNVWLRTFELPRRDSVRWRVFDRTGRAVAYCDLPIDLFVDEIGSDYVTGIQRGIGRPERAAMFRLLKDSSASAGRDATNRDR